MIIDYLIKSAYAYEITVPIPGGRGQEYNNFSEYLSDIFKWAIVIGQALAILVIIYGAVLYTTSAGDEGKIKEAKEYIIGAVIGFALLLLTNLIIKTIGIQ